MIHARSNVLMLGFIVVVGDGELRLNSDEITEAHWYSFDEALGQVQPDSTAEFFLKNAIAEIKKNKL